MNAESRNVGVGQFLELLERLAPARLAESWDNPGLQVGGDGGNVTKVFISLDPTLGALRRAREAGADLLFTHHPLIFRPLTRIEAAVYPGNVIHEAVKAGVTIFSAHTNLDVAVGGINDILAESLGLEEVAVLEEAIGAEGAGLGRVGRLPGALRLSGLARAVRDRLDVENMGVSGPEDGDIRTVAVVGGSGGGMIAAAHRKGADCLITGDVGHHHALTAEAMGVTVLDAGHYSLEKKAFSIFGGRLAKQMAERGWKVDVVLDDAETTPVRWVAA
jgi:dinuclear metal center YbgI/SA1388 family protein